MPYRHIEPSNPAYTRDGLHCLTFESDALGQRGTVSVHIPPGHEHTPDLPMVLLLHGVYGNHWSWPYMAGAHLRAQQLLDAKQIRPFGLLMPSDGLHAAGSGYVRHPGRDCEAWIVDDVVGCAREHYPCFSSRSPLFISGFSMGGLGALRLGAKHAGLFRGISAHASCTHYDQLGLFFGTDFSPETYLSEEDKSALHWIVRNRDHLPLLRFDCGRDDRLYKYNMELHEALQREGIPHRFDAFPGTHSWAYCHEHLAESLRFFDALLEDTRR